jgi:hypothetical protein
MSEGFRLIKTLGGLDKVGEYSEIIVLGEIPSKNGKDWRYYVIEIETPIFYINTPQWQRFKALLREYAKFSSKSEGWVYLGRGKGRGFKKVRIYKYFDEVANYFIHCIFIKDLVVISIPKPVKIDRAYTHWGAYKGTYFNLMVDALENFNNEVELVEGGLRKSAETEKVITFSLKDIEDIIKLLIKLLKLLGGEDGN